MHIAFDRLDFVITENTKRTRGFRGGPGFYWQETSLPPVGVFPTASDALRDLAAHLESGALARALEANEESRRARGLPNFD